MAPRAYVPEMGDVVWIAFDPQAAHEQAGHRTALDGQTPLRRARTPWGMNKVQAMLVGLCFGSAA